MWELLATSFFLDSLIPHGYCYLWKPSLVSLQTVSDLLIALAYYSLPLMLVYFVQRRQDVPFNRIFLLSSAFIIAGGTTHVLEVWTLWHQDYWLSGAMKALTAMLSLYTAIELLPLIPKLLALPSPAQLEAANYKLQTEISERQQAEAKIYFQARLLDVVEQAVIATDLEGIIIYWNRFAQKLYGWSLEEVVGCNMMDFVVAPHSQEQTAQIISHLQAGSSWHGEILLRRRDCTTFPAIVTFAPIFDRNRMVSGMVSSAADITERVQAQVALLQVNEALELRVEERTSALKNLNQQLKTEIVERQRAAIALQESEAKFRSIVENANDIIYLLSLNGFFDYVSPNWTDILGHDVKEVEGRSFIPLVHPDDLPACLDFFQKVVETASKQAGVEYRVKHKNGSWRWHTSNASALKEANGNVKYFVGIARDITERKQVENDLRESEERFRQLAENINQVFWITTPDLSQKLYVSPAYEQIWGRSCSSLYSQPNSWMDQIHLEDRKHVLANIERQNQIPIDHEFRIVRPDGSDRWIRDRTFPVKNALGLVTRVVGIAEDITERKQAEEEMKKTLEKEKELGLLKSHLITTISHEYRTPLTVVLGASEMLRQYGHKLSEEKKQKHISRIQEAVKQMTMLVENVLTFGKAEVGQLSFNPRLLCVETFCRDLIEEQQLLVKSDYNLSLTYQGNCTTAHLDVQLLRHILTNLLTNAIKYSPRGSQILLKAICQDDRVIFSVEDQGIGIPPSEQQRLFETFFRASNVGTISGTGMGLAIVKKCVLQHDGQISVESEVDVGTTFTVNLPNYHTSKLDNIK